MTKMGIIYFSGTGNTKFVAENMKAELEKNKIEADLINIEKDELKEEDYKKYEALIIGAPVYVDRYPEILFKYIKDIPKDYKSKCMLFSTQASIGVTSSFQHFINRVKYLNVTYCRFITMPNNFYNFMFKRLSDDEEKKLVNDSIAVCKDAVNDFLGGKTNFYPVKKSKVIAINFIYNMFYPLLAKLMTRKVKIDKNKCIKCGLCESKCPVKAIRVRDKVKIDNECLLCQRCMSNCPKDAFYYKNKKYVQYKLRKS